MNSVSDNIYRCYAGQFEGMPLMVRSPGRINLIGEHTDYNDGFVLPAAIDKSVFLAMSRNGKGKIRLYSADIKPGYFEVALDRDLKPSERAWVNYVLGVVRELQQLGYETGGFDCAFGGDLPIGSGLSSSAALCAGVVYGLARLCDLELSRLDMARIAQNAENNFAGVQCGIMDPYASLHGISDKVLRLDCRTLEHEYFPFERDDLIFLLFDSGVKRKLASSEYNTRRQQCMEGVRIIGKKYPGITALRDATLAMIESCINNLPEVVYRRCKYVVQENNRVLDACEDLAENDWAGFGRRMKSSHDGLRDLYEVSCKELDVLADHARRHPAVLGARMMGGGFGGCTINLVEAARCEEVMANVCEGYQRETGRFPVVHQAHIGAGTSIL